MDFLIFNTKYPKSLIYIINQLLADLRELPKNGNTSHLSNFEEPVFKVFSMITLTTTKKLLETNEDDYVYKFFSANTLHRFNESLTVDKMVKAYMDIYQL